MNKIFTPLFFLFLIGNFSSAFSQSNTTVTFKVNMNEQIARGQFDPNSETLDIAGSFNNWGSPGLDLSDTDGDGIYTATRNFNVGESIELKARINGEWNGREEFAGGGANRQFTIVVDGIIEFWYNDELPDNILQVNISASTNYGLPNELVQFTDQSNGNPVSWQWNFPGGSPESSIEQNPMVIYTAEGKYDVSLTVTNEEGDSETKVFENYISIGNQDVHWWNDAVFYEVFVRSFYDSDGDGIGDFNGLTEKLDYLNDGNPATQSDLGVTGIWLMPINESPSYHGYDVTDYRKVEPEYGTNEDFKAFIAAAHARGIKVIIDYVMNHSSSQHPWFIESKNEASEKRDWYVWESSNPGGSGPWGQTIWHPSNGEYFYGLFWSGMPDINYEGEGVKEEMFDIATFWLEDMDIDGFRLDAVKYIYETDAGLEDNEETFQFWRDFRTHYKGVKPEAFAVGEAWTSTDKAKKYVDSDGLDYVFEFDLANAILGAVNNGNASGIISKTAEVMGSYPYLQFGTFLSNHDINRLMNLLSSDEEKVRQAAEILFTLPGIPYIYYGEEIGMLGVKPDEDIRLPLQWDNSANAGFTTGSPWRAPKADYTSKNISAQQRNPESLWRNYHQLVNTRNSQIALRRGNYRNLTASDNNVYAFLRSYENENVFMVANLANAVNSGIQISLNSSDIEAGAYVLVDLLTGQQENVAIAGGGSLTLTLDEMGAKQTRIYKLLKEEMLLAQIELMVDMSEQIASSAFNPNVDKVLLISDQNNFGVEVIELLDESGDGIYKTILDEMGIGSAVQYKYAINEIENGREEFPDSEYLRTYRVKEGENPVLDRYNQVGSTITSAEPPINKEPEIILFPNPTDAFITISYENVGASPISYQIFDARGRVKSVGEIAEDKNQISTQELSDGLYFMRLNTGRSIVNKKFIVVR